MPGRRASAPNPAGAHYLRDAALIARLVRASGAGEGRLVLDMGAGHGAITAALASSGARVIAIERDPRCAAGLRRRVAGHPRVSVVEADLREVRLPRRDFLVVASVPFSITTALLRRLTGDPSVPLAGAELLVAWGVARWLTATVPRDAETAWWTARYQMRIARRVPAASFAPPPRAVARLRHAAGPGAVKRRSMIAADRGCICHRMDQANVRQHTACRRLRDVALNPQRNAPVRTPLAGARVSR